jgi:hypothetical protein
MLFGGLNHLAKSLCCVFLDFSRNGLISNLDVSFFIGMDLVEKEREKS